MWAYGQSPDIRSAAECERCPETAIVREVTTNDEIRRVFALCSNVADTDDYKQVKRERERERRKPSKGMRLRAILLHCNC